MELHDWLMFFHILGAVVWVGGMIVTSVALERANRSPGRTAMPRVARDVEWVGRRLLGPSAAVVIGVGIWLVPVEGDLSFSQLWIWLALVLVAVTAVLSMYSGPEGERISRLADERGAEDGEVRRRFSRVLWLTRLNILILVAVLWLMVFKPGGPTG